MPLILRRRLLPDSCYCLESWEWGEEQLLICLTRESVFVVTLFLRKYIVRWGYIWPHWKWRDINTEKIVNVKQEVRVAWFEMPLDRFSIFNACIVSSAVDVSWTLLVTFFISVRRRRKGAYYIGYAISNCGRVELDLLGARHVGCGCRCWCGQKWWAWGISGAAHAGCIIVAFSLLFWCFWWRVIHHANKEGGEKFFRILLFLFFLKIFWKKYKMGCKKGVSRWLEVHW